jgi:ADP-heptose:LPS heptosyltransferase
MSREFRQSVWRLVFDHKKRATLNLDRPVKILFDQKENLIGDMIVNTVAFHEIKKAHPDWTIHVLAGAANREVISSNPHVDKIHLFSGLWSAVKSLRQERFDIYYFHKNRLTPGDFFLLKYVDSKVNVGRNKADFQLFDYSIDAPSETEFDRFARFLELLGVDDVDCRYEFHLTSAELSQGKSYVGNLSGRPVIAFNRYGHRRGKLFSHSRAIQLIREINRVYKEAAIVLLCSPATKNETIRMQRELELVNVHAATSTRTIRDSAAIVHHADLVVTPDTSIVHIACAFDKPQICVYRDRTELKLWRPMSDKAIVLLPQSPSRHVDDLDVAEFSQALQTVRAWLPSHPLHQ